MKPSFIHSWIKYRRLRQAQLTGMALLYLLLTSRVVALDPNKDLHEYACHTWNYQNGLPVTSVHALAQTKDGISGWAHPKVWCGLMA